MRTIGYTRVSSIQQASEGISLDAQAEKIRAMAVVQGIELTDVIIDSGYSAKSLDRPGIQQVLELISSGQAQAVMGLIQFGGHQRSVLYGVHNGKQQCQEAGSSDSSEFYG